MNSLKATFIYEEGGEIVELKIKLKVKMMENLKEEYQLCGLRIKQSIYVLAKL